MEENTELSENGSRLKKQIITDPATIRALFQKDKLQILNILLREAKNIQQLKEATKINPGTIKRNLDDLIGLNLVKEAGIKKSSYNITMKYYIATAEEFEFQFKLPVDDIQPYIEKYKKE